jgi:poly-beta-1,6-N-acetyl-D-glucosamine synthase
MSGSQIGLIAILFWCGILVIFYAYIGYGILLWLLVKAKRMLSAPLQRGSKETADFPKVTFIVCAFNESEWIVEKVINSLNVEYPADKIRFVFVTDGSSDDTPDKTLEAFRNAGISSAYYVLHEHERRGKIAAFHRAMLLFGEWGTPHIIISTDANTLLNTHAVLKMVAHFADPQTGAVAGEKRIQMGDKDAANAAGEGIYWQYESLLKKCRTMVGSRCCRRTICAPDQFI